MPTYRNDGEDILVIHGESFEPGEDQTIGWYIEHSDLTLVSDFPPAIVDLDEIIQSVSDTLTAAELKGIIISNYGQGASDNLQMLPRAAEGMSFVAVCGTAQDANYFRFQADTNDKIYLDGTAGSDNGYVEIAAPVVGAKIVFFTFQTGANVYDWAATTVSGTWVAG
jgi:hypothetical protein